jgi:hypothetical protein
MNRVLLVSFTVLLLLRPGVLQASDADDITILVTAQNSGPVPFINQLTLSASDTSKIKTIQFTIAPKTGSVTRPLSGNYSAEYLSSRGYLFPDGTIYLPVYGLYDGYANNVTLTYYFLDGSSSQAVTTITTGPFSDPCGYKTPTVLQARTQDRSLSYDYFMVKERCDTYSPAILDTDGELRWVGTASIADISATLYDNAVYIASGTQLYRIDLDGTVTFLHDYADLGVTFLHHNIDRGKFGLVLDAQTATSFQSTDLEVDASGNVLKIWDMAAIITAVMTAGGDDPSQFVYPAPTDWWHNNSTTYNRADDSIIISSRENFVICLDYETDAIKWILGDTTKKWYSFPSLARYALALGPNTIAPAGQHSVSITYDQNLLLYDNGEGSFTLQPPGVTRGYSAPRKYHLDLENKVATEVWNYENGRNIFTYICSSVYEDAPNNYLVDYSYVPDPAGGSSNAQLLGLNAAGEKVFNYQYGPIEYCDTAFNSIPLHLENTRFPTIGPQALNLSTRGFVGSTEDSLIGGFIITGTSQKKLLLRALGPSLGDSDPSLTGTVTDPLLTLYDSSGNLISINDDWQSDPQSAEIVAENLAPAHPSEAATIEVLSPGAYTFVVNDKNLTAGLGLIEAYDLSPTTGGQLSNLSTRGMVGTGDNVVISGVIVGDVASATLCIRALGPSLSGLSHPLADPSVAIYDANGAILGSNDDWDQDPNAVDIDQLGLAPKNAAEAATLLHLPAGSYTAVESGAGGAAGSGLIEFYVLD